ncbi:MAG: topoisomerase C-terminal repeat-containing protein, partial [Hyphomicrobiaceae bacterium]
ANLPQWEDLFTIGLNHAVSLIADKVAGKGQSRFGRTKPTALREVGEHPDGGKIEVFSGKYGPYLKWTDVNATLPKSKDPATISLAEAIEVIAERVASGGAKKKPARKAKAPAKKATAKPPAKSKAKAKAPAKGKAKPKADAAE